MNMWDMKWIKMMKEWKVDLREYVRYMDDGRVFMSCIQRGWRWEGGELVWMKEWECEDEGLSLKEVSKRIVDKSMQEVLPFLKFTTEIEDDFVDGWLPTLDWEGGRGEPLEQQGRVQSFKDCQADTGGAE